MKERIARSGVLDTRRWRSPRRILLLAVFVAGSLFYAWTASTAGTRTQFGGYPDYYAQLTEGFLEGHLSIPTPPPKGLLELKDPYDPLQNQRYRTSFGDLALYHGHLYLDWGPAPVLTLYMPAHLLGIGTPSGNLAVWLYSVFGLGFTLLFLCALLDDYLPRVRTRWVVLVALAITFGNAVPFIDREPDNYEVAVACGYCFAMIGLYLLERGCLGERFRPKLLLLASFSLGLAAASRQDLALLIALPAVATVYELYKHRPIRLRPAIRVAAIYLAPFIVILFLLALYNFARFGSPTQIGSSYQLAGFNPRQTPYYLLAYLLPSYYFYFVSPLHWTLSFPFIAIPPPIPPLTVPISYAPQIIDGIFSQTPLLSVLVLSPLVVRKRIPRVLTGVLCALALSGFLVVTVIALSIPGGSERYVVDFATLFLVPASFVWLAWSPRRFIGRVLVRGFGTALILYGIAAGIAVSITGYYNQISYTSPGFYSAMTRGTSGIGTFIVKILGHPVLTSIETNAGITTQGSTFSFGIGTVLYMNLSGTGAQLDITAPSSGTFAIQMNVGPGPQYGDTTKRTIEFVISDTTGTHVIPYTGFAGYRLPVHLAEGRNAIDLSVIVKGKSLPADDSLLSASFLSLTNS